MKKYLLLAGVVTLVALLFAAIGSASLSVWPEPNLRLVERVVCPAGQSLEYRSLGQFTYTDSDGTHNQERIAISCLATDGTRVEGQSGATVGALFGLYFLICLVPLLAAGALWRWSLVRRSQRGV